MKVQFSLMKNLLTPLAENILLLLRLTAAVPLADAGIQKNIYGSGMITLIIWLKKSLE